MATCRDIVNGALRKMGKLAGGREPRTQDSADALDSLKGVYSFLIGSGAFGRLRDVVPTGASYTAGENERIFRNSDVTTEIDLPELVPVDAPHLPRSYADEPIYYSEDPTDQSSRPPRDCSVVIINDAFTGTTVEYIYDGQQKLWQSLYDLSLDSEAPLSRRDPDGLKAFLAVRIADEFGGELGPVSVALAGAFQTNLVTRFSSAATIGAGVYF